MRAERAQSTPAVGASSEVERASSVAENLEWWDRFDRETLHEQCDREVEKYKKTVAAGRSEVDWDKMGLGHLKRNWK